MRELWQELRGPYQCRMLITGVPEGEMGGNTPEIPDLSAQFFRKLETALKKWSVNFFFIGEYGQLQKLKGMALSYILE